VDVSELRTLAADLGKVSGKVTDDADRVLKRGAQNLKEGMQKRFDASDSFRRKRKGRPLRVSYDRVAALGSLGYEIGPEIGGMGSLAHIAVDGGANGGGGKVDIDSLLPPEAAAIEKHLGKVLDGLL
jgi:hypothetical protein